MSRLAVLISLCLILGSVHAEESNDSITHYRANLGFGAGTEGPAFLFSGVRQEGSTFIMLRLSTTSENTISSDDLPQESAWDIGALYGWSFHSEALNASAALGISYVQAIRRGKFLGRDHGIFPRNRYEEVVREAVGLPIELGIFTTPLRFMGVGVFYFANVNTARSFMGGGIAVQFGNMR